MTLCQAEFEYILALSQRLLLSQGNASSTVRIFVKRGIEFLCAILLKSIKEDDPNVNKFSKDPMQAAITYIQKIIVHQLHLLPRQWPLVFLRHIFQHIFTSAWAFLFPSTCQRID